MKNKSQHIVTLDIIQKQSEALQDKVPLKEWMQAMRIPCSLLAKFLGIDRSMVFYVLKGQRNFSEKIWAKLNLLSVGKIKR